MIIEANMVETGITASYRIVKRDDDTEMVARTSSGVSEVGTSGLFTVDVSDVYGNGHYRAEWDHSGNLPYAAEDIPMLSPASSSAVAAPVTVGAINASGLADLAAWTAYDESASEDTFAGILSRTRAKHTNIRIVDRVAGTEIVYEEDGSTPFMSHTVADTGASVT